MAISYVALLSVNLSHAYYKDEICRDLLVKPTSECAVVMKRLGLLFRQLNTGFTVFCRVGDDKKTLYQAFDIRKKLSFYLHSRNPYLVNISALPWDMDGGKILNLHNRQRDDGDDKQALSVASDYVGKEDLIESKPQQFSFEYQLEADSKATSILVEIFDATKSDPESDEARVQSMTIPRVDEQRVLVQVDLLCHSAGVFLMHIDGKEQMRFYADNNLFRDKAFAVIDLFASAAVETNYRFIDVMGAVLLEKAAAFEINFKQRQMKWRYNVVMKHQAVDKDSLQIALDADSDTPLFDKVSAEAMTDGVSIDSYPVVSFVSKKPRDFNERSEKSLQLKKGADILIQNLPAPTHSSPLKAEKNSDGNYILDSENNKILYCETFVYI